MPENDLALLTEAAKAAGRIALSFFKEDPQVWEKPGQGPVSEADLAVDAMLSELLRAARPDYGWLSEETADDGTRLTTHRQFIIDPIDGTRAFLEGSRDWSHSLAVIEDGKPIAAVVYLPARSDTFAAAKGWGATHNGDPIRASASVALAQAHVLTTKPTLNPANWLGAPPTFKKGYRSSLAYRMALAASGRFDAMLSLHKTWEWDIAAGALIVAEAGGRITDQRGAPLQFNRADPRLDGIVAGGHAIHGALMGALL